MTQRRIEELLSREAPRIRDRFRQVMARLRGERGDSETAKRTRAAAVSKLEQALSEGRISQVLDDVEKASGALASRVEATINLSGHETAAYLSTQVDAIVSYDAANPRAIEVLQRNRARLVAGITDSQREAIVDVLSAAQQKGENPRKTAVRIREVIGLSRSQAARVQAYRDRLETPTPLNPDEPIDPEAPPRKPAPAKTPEQIDRLVERFADRQVKARAETIARTEALSAVHEGLAQGFQQAIDGGAIQADLITQKWDSGDDGRTRPWHKSMDGQEQPWGTPFVSGKGNQLRWPGDVNAPAEERKNCRCAVARRIAKPKPAPVEKGAPMVICIAGGPGTGKTTLGKALAAECGLPLLSTDDFIGLGWSEASEHIAEKLADGAARVVEGVAVPRALRKALAARPTVKPCDRLIVLTKVHRAQTPKQAQMGAGVHTVLDAIIPALLALGVELDVRTDASAAA